ncbi:MAG: hypothetical protein RIG84_18125 [Roseovarius sp.]
MAADAKRGITLTGVAVAAFAGVTALLLLPGYFKSWEAEPPGDAAFYVQRAFETRQRVFHEDGHFGRIEAGAAFGEVTRFDCARSAAARREFGWRGAREVLFDCVSVFSDGSGKSYAWVFRLAPDDDPLNQPSPEGYRAIHIDIDDVIDILEAEGLWP